MKFLTKEQIVQKLTKLVYDSDEPMWGCVRWDKFEEVQTITPHKQSKGRTRQFIRGTIPFSNLRIAIFTYYFKLKDLELQYDKAKNRGLIDDSVQAEYEVAWGDIDFLNQEELTECISNFLYGGGEWRRKNISLDALEELTNITPNPQNKERVYQLRAGTYYCYSNDMQAVFTYFFKVKVLQKVLATIKEDESEI